MQKNISDKTFAAKIRQRQYVSGSHLKLRHVLDLQTSYPTPRQGSGTFRFRFRMIGKPNPLGKADPDPEKEYDFWVEYRISYTFGYRGDLFQFAPSRPIVLCFPN
jgi:hypothetical protein